MLPCHATASVLKRSSFAEEEECTDLEDEAAHTKNEPKTRCA